MQGDIKKLQESIDKTYQQKLDVIKASLEADLATATDKVKEQKDSIKVSYAAKLKAETELANKKEQSLAICDARSEFDVQKQEILDGIFDDIVSDAKSVESKEYSNAVSEAISGLSSADAKNATLIVSAKTLVPSSFKGTVATTKDFLGVKLQSGESLVDLSLETLIETKRESVAVLMHDALFN